jgi:cysteinyl-tRNA synthetase
VWSKNIIRILFLTHHYRTPVDLSNKKLEEIKKSLTNLKKKLQINKCDSSNFKQLWVSAMLDDFNTAKAFGFYFKFINDGKLSNQNESEMNEFEQVMGISGWRDEIIEDNKENSLDADLIEKIILERDKARGEKNWKKADQLRKDAESKGVRLLDDEKGTTWEFI